MAGLSCFLAAVLEKLHSVLELPNLDSYLKPPSFLLLVMLPPLLPLHGFIKEEIKISHVSLLEKLKLALTSISNVITDAEENQFQQDTVKNWLEDLEEALYDAEDVVDEILYDNKRIKLEAESLILKLSARGLIPASDQKNAKLRRSIRKLVQVIDAIAKQKEDLCLREIEARKELAFSGSYSLPVSNSLLDENQIYGRDEDKHNVLALLLYGDKTLDAITLIGMGGLGKTTLAKLVYNNRSVGRHFELKAWISVGSQFDVYRITREILVAFTGYSSFGEFGLDMLQRKLKETLDGKRFLLVLDDVWNEDTSKWEALRSSLESGYSGSKIFVTTRMAIVADVIGCSTRYLLRPLTMEDCWSILGNSAFAGRDRSEVKAVDDVGRKIVEKCGGLPFIAREIGGLLRSKKTREEWRNVLEDLETVSFGNQTGDSILKPLRLSYYHLPAQLKRCFAYCSLFPKGYEFDKEELLHLWMAEGFLQQSTVHSLERVGDDRIYGLLKRSFFIPLDNSCFIMHDLMHDLAMSVSRPYCFRLEPKTSVIPRRIQHLSLERNQYDTAHKLTATGVSDVLETKMLRTLYLINSPSGHGSCQLSPKELNVLFARQQRLRVLSLPHFEHAELPESIGQLQYLRYLDVSDSALKRLPESLCTLYYLQTLILTNCSALLMLPKGIVKLVNLRKLQIKGTGLKQMPEKIVRLTSLQSLSNFIVGHGGSSIKELGAFPHLRGSLSVSELQNVSFASDASAANLKAMQHLEELELEWSCNNENSAAGQEQVLENLEPYGELKKLSIRFYGGRVFPNWLGDSSFLKITSLHLADCRNCKSLPSLGQLSLLEHLTVERFSGIKCIGREFYGVDISLKTLKFREMSHWEEWIVLEEFRSLEELYIINCPKFIGGMPKSLPALKKLEIAECESLAASLPWTPEGCILRVETSYTGQKETEDEIVSEGDGEPSSQLESDGTKKIPADKGAVEDDFELYGKLEKPSMGSYGDKVLQERLEFSSISQTTSLCISDNDNCSSLPPLGQLPLLEHLRIERMGGVRSIGSEFYGLDFPFRKPFQSLKTLKFEAMSQWELWTTVEVEGEEFPCLQELYIINCPKLKGDLPKSLPSLIKLEISECQQLEAVLPLTSKHCVLKLENCDKVQMRSDDDQTVAPHVSPSIMHQEEDDNQEEPSAGEDGNQQSIMAAAAGTGFQELMVAILGAIKSAAMFREVLEELQSTLLTIQPLVLDKAYKMKQFEEIISEGHKLIGKCSTIPRWKFYKKKSYTNKLRALKRSLELFCQVNMQTQQTSDVKDTLAAKSCEVPEPSGKLEKCDRVHMRSDDDQTAAPQASPSMMHHHQDGNYQEKPLSGEDGNQQPPSMSSNFSSMGIAKNQVVAAGVSPSSMHQEQDNNQEKPLAGEDGNQQLPSSSSDFSSMGIAKNQVVAPGVSPSSMHQEQDDNEKEPLVREDGNQHLPSSSSEFSNMRIAQNQAVAPEVSPSSMHQEQDDNQEEPLAGEDENQQLSSSSSDISSMGIAQNQVVAPGASPSSMHQEQDDNEKEPLVGEDGNQQLPSSSSEFSNMGIAQNQAVAPEVSPSSMHQEQDDNQEEPLAGEDRNQQLSSSSSDFSSVGIAQNKVVAPGVSPSSMHQQLDDNEEEHLVGEDGNKQLPSSSSEFSNMGIAQNQAVAPEISPSSMHQEQDDNQEEPLAGEDGNQQLPSSSSDFSSVGIAQNQVVATGVCPSSIHQEQEDNEEEPLVGEDGNQQLPSSSSDFSSVGIAQNQVVATGVCPSSIHQEQEDNEEEPLVGEDGNQQLPSSSSEFSNMGIAQNQAVVPEVSPSSMHQEQDDNQEELLAGEDGNQQLPSSSSDFSSMGIAQNQVVAPRVSPSSMHQEHENEEEPSVGEDGNQHLPSSSLEFSNIGIAQNQAVAPEVSPSTMHQEKDDNQEEPLADEDGNHRLPSSSMNVSSMGNAQSMEETTDNSLRIEKYALDVLPEEKLKRSSFQHLYVIDCINLKTFPLSPSWKTLYIQNCRSLEFPQSNEVKNQDLLLEDLSLGSSCDSLKNFPLNYFPKLKALSLWDCRYLESFSIGKDLQPELTSLESLEIKNCPKFRSFLDEKCQAPNLTSLVFFNCGSLKSLQWMQSFKSLQSLYIDNCPELDSLPEEGLPSSLVILCISFCNKITPLKEWKLFELKSLRHFEIEGECLSLKSFPEEGLLPTNLNSLRISGLSDLTSLDGKGLQSLTSLRTLEINCCNKLCSLPETRLPSSLSSLSITNCSQLNRRLLSKKREWFKIAHHISSIHIDEVSD
ncbi:hypothetical protein PTKIN_Ptkin16aG0019300 [Pterospermum kingtungense]